MMERIKLISGKLSISDPLITQVTLEKKIVEIFIDQLILVNRFS